MTHVTDRSDDEWTKLSSTFYGNNHGANGSRKQLTDLLVLAGVTPPAGIKYRDLQRLFIEVREEISHRASAILNRRIAAGFTQAFAAAASGSRWPVTVEPGKMPVIEVNGKKIDTAVLRDKNLAELDALRAWNEKRKATIEARSVVETDAWGVKRVVGGFGDVGGPGTKKDE